MPYRRLPNTDKSRLKAIENALNKNKNYKNEQIIISPSNEYKLKLKLDEFKYVLSNYRNAFVEQRNYNKIYNELLHKTRLYLSHFIQIINFAIARGEYSAKIRKYYGFSPNTKILPSLQTFEEIDYWCQKIINGEQERVAAKGTPFQSPSIASINTLNERFKDADKNLRNLKRKTTNAKIKLIAIRPEIDELIKETWDQIESHFENYPSMIKREKSKAFGIIYFYRKNEEKIELKDLLKL